MKARQPCGDCPFKCGSPNGYDADGLELLDEGREPGCHKIVGPSLQFDDPFPNDDTICIGYLNWLGEKENFQKPYLVGT